MSDIILYIKINMSVIEIVIYIAFLVYIANNKYTMINIDIREIPITGTSNIDIVILYPDIKFDNILILFLFI